jgi:hypothetical protein
MSSGEALLGIRMQHPWYRRLRTKLGAPKAITAMAHKLARLVYRMLKYGQEYVDKGMQYYEGPIPPSISRIPQKKRRKARSSNH